MDDDSLTMDGQLAKNGLAMERWTARQWTARQWVAWQRDMLLPSSCKYFKNDWVNGDSRKYYGPIFKKFSFLRNSFQLPPDVAFQVHCLSEISRHRGNYLNLFNQVIQCVSGHALYQSVDFRTLHVMSHDQFLRYLCHYYRLDFLKPTMHNLSLSDGSVVTVPIFDVKATLLSFLNDPNRMRRVKLVNQQKRIHRWMKFTQEPYGMLRAENIVAMIPIPFHWRWCAFMTKHTQIYMGR